MVQKFFCWELLTAGLIIGWLGVLESIPSIVSSALMLANVDTYFDPSKFPDYDPAVMRQVVINIMGTNIAFNVIDLLASGMLIVGTIKKNRLFLLPWLVNTGLSLLFFIIVTIIVTVCVFTTSDHDTFISAIIVATVCIIVTAFYSYVWNAIHSLYKHFRLNVPQDEYSRLVGSSTGPVYTRA